MTGMDAPTPPAPDRRDPKSPHELVPHVPTQGRGEIQVEPNAVVVTFHLPEFEPGDLEYRVGSRTVCLWSKRAGQDFRTIVVLPLWVNPEQFVLHHNNGVYEFVMAAQEAAGIAA